MTTKPKSPFVSVHLTAAARDALRSATLQLTTPASRRVSMSDVLLALAEVAMEHQADVVTKLRSAA